MTKAHLAAKVARLAHRVRGVRVVHAVATRDHGSTREVAGIEGGLVGELPNIVVCRDRVAQPCVSANTMQHHSRCFPAFAGWEYHGVNTSSVGQ